MKKFFLSLLMCSILLHSCSIEGDDFIGNDDFIENTDNPSLEISDFRNWFKSQEIVTGFMEQEPNWNNAELTISQDGDNSAVSIEIYKGKNSLGNDSIRELLIANVENDFIGGVRVFSYYNNERARVEYYNLGGQILEKAEYYAPKQLYSLIERYTVEIDKIEWSPVRLKSGSESGSESGSGNLCAGTRDIAPATKITEGVPNANAYNCHAYVWGYLKKNDPLYDSSYPKWNNYPDISHSGYSLVIGSAPRVGDRWVSYGYVYIYGNFNYMPIHSAIVEEVKNGKVTKLRAKCGQGPVKIYNPDCSDFSSYKTNTIKYYRK
jgi:hypothetical protein